MLYRVKKASSGATRPVSSLMLPSTVKHRRIISPLLQRWALLYEEGIGFIYLPVQHPFSNHWTRNGGLPEVVSVLPSRQQADMCDPPPSGHVILSGCSPSASHPVMFSQINCDG